MERQADRVLALLRIRGEAGLTSLEALDLVGSMRLASRIEELRSGKVVGLRADEVIDAERVHRNGKTYARYVLRKRVAAGMTQTTLGW